MEHPPSLRRGGGCMQESSSSSCRFHKSLYWCSTETKNNAHKCRQGVDRDYHGFETSIRIIFDSFWILCLLVDIVDIIRARD